MSLALYRMPPAWFFTLTYQRNEQNGPRIKRDFKTFRERLQHRDPASLGHWVVEAQIRGALHLHVVVWSHLDDWSTWAPGAWCEISDQPSRAALKHAVRVEGVDDVEKVLFYLLKYVTKGGASEWVNPDTGEITAGPEGIGRFWAAWGDLESFRVPESAAVHLVDAWVVDFRRWCRSMVRARRRCALRGGDQRLAHSLARVEKVLRAEYVNSWFLTGSLKAPAVAVLARLRECYQVNESEPVTAVLGRDGEAIQPPEHCPSSCRSAASWSRPTSLKLEHLDE